jgi:6-phosphofructokinase
MAKKRIGILTGGGDVAGLNSVIKTVAYRSSENDIELIGLRRGWEALTQPPGYGPCIGQPSGESMP